MAEKKNVTNHDADYDRWGSAPRTIHVIKPAAKKKAATKKKTTTGRKK